MNISDKGIILTDNVDMEFLKSLSPRFHSKYVKFVINVESNQVCIGMDVHANCLLNKGNKGEEEHLYGGNIFFDDSSIIYESTLNIPKNLKLRNFKGNPRIITDAELMTMIEAVLLAWVKI